MVNDNQDKTVICATEPWAGDNSVIHRIVWSRRTLCRWRRGGRILCVVVALSDLPLREVVAPAARGDRPQVCARRPSCRNSGNEVKYAATARA